jgi:hypothetical protein
MTPERLRHCRPIVFLCVGGPELAVAQAELALEAAGGPLADHFGDFAEQAGKILGLNEHRIAAAAITGMGAGIGIGCKQSCSRLVVHHSGMGQYF